MEAGLKNLKKLFFDIKRANKHLHLIGRMEYVMDTLIANFNKAIQEEKHFENALR
jgi:hypothetical protein